MRTIGIAQIVLILMILGLSACGEANDKPAYDVDALPETASAENGRKIFEDGASGAPKCVACHTVDGDDQATGPSLKGFAPSAGERVSGQSAREYALNSIIAPGAHLTSGYGNVMYGSYGDKLSKQQIADVIEYLLTLD